MLFVSLFKWWYRDGWMLRARTLNTQLDGVVDYFSIDLLLKTLFSPFRQDGAGASRVSGSFEIKLRALADNLISRMIGAVIRSVILVVGLVAIAVFIVYGFVTLIVWAVIPAAPIIGVAFAAIGVTV